MRIAFLITTYKSPSQVERLIRSLYHVNFDFYIHIDGNVDENDFTFLEKIDRVSLIKNRCKVTWGGYSFTKAIINSLVEIINTGKEYRCINLISSQDYPIKPVNYIHDYLIQQAGLSFISYSLPDAYIWWRQAKYRITTFNFNDYRYKGKYIIQRLLNSVITEREFPLQLPLYGSSCATWWTMDIECAKYVVDFINSNKQLNKFMRFTWGADEFLIPTIVMGSPFKDQVVNNNLRYIDWSRGGDRPKTLGIEDLNALAQSEKLFARKFDPVVDATILNEIDQIITSNY
ncbi:beta-1,6-N-acetylglucosaminyltransferase [Spirosoma aerophilum]